MNRIAQTMSLGALATAALLASVTPVHAMPTLTTQVLPIYQVGNGAGVNLGHVVTARTNFNKLTAGGTFVASCANSSMSPVAGQRTLSADGLLGGLSLVVTIPEWVPATVSMPGFYSLTRGTTVYCTYTWTSRAVEGGYSIGANGITFPIGGTERADGFAQPFQMSVPGDTNSDDWQSCIP